MSVELAVYRYTEGDNLPLLRVRFAKASGVPVNYAGMSVVLRISKTGGGVLEKTAALSNAQTGEYVIEFAPGDLVRGKHMSTISFIDDAGRKLTTRKILFDVSAPIE